MEIAISSGNRGISGLILLFEKRAIVVNCEYEDIIKKE